MGKKKTPVFRDGADKNSSSTKEDKINAIRTWSDVEHDSEDDFHDDREKILLNNNQESEQDESDREIYGLDGIDSEEELSEDEIIGKQEEEEVEDKTWGTSKKAYYDADEGSDLDEMREEEEEALRIQKEHLSHMDEADFVDDALSGWGLGNNEDVEADKKLVEDVSKELEDISFDKLKIEKRRKNLPIAEKLKIIQNESPELIDLLDEFKENVEGVKLLESIVQKIQAKGKDQDETAQFILFKYQTLMNYMTNISFYFALKASETTDIRDHPVIQALFKLRQTLEKLDELEEKLQDDIQDFVTELEEEEEEEEQEPVAVEKREKKTKSSNKKKAVKFTPVQEDSDISDDDLQASEQEESENEQDILNEIQEIEEEFKSLKKAAKKRKRTVTDDFGELEALDEVDMEDKIIKKKSIRDYVAKIDSKQAKNANRYQGDVDLPYRDRVKQERKGVAQPQDTSADLDTNDWDEEDTAAADEVRNGKQDSDDEYYSEVVANKEALKQSKLEAYEAERPAIESRETQVMDGQKRLATYKILKNKGLTPHRKKENRNARVKHRNKYAKQMKKLSSTRAVVKPQTSGYGGEMSGVKTNVVKSVKLSQ